MENPRDCASGPAILFVDDDLSNLQALPTQLAHELSVLVAHDAVRALELLEQRASDIGMVVAAQGMAGMTGTELLVKVRQRYPAIERMIMTAHSELPPIIAAINEGQISGCISKPWNPTDLRVILRGGIERYRLRRSLEEANLKLLQAEQNSVLAFLAAGVGHEINNPAMVIRLNLHLLDERLGLPLAAWLDQAVPQQERQRRERAVQQIRCSVSDLSSAVDMLQQVAANLRLLSPAHTDDEVAFEPVNVNAIVSRALGFLRKQIEYRGQLVQELHASCCARANTAKLTQVLINLCTNAIQAMDGVSGREPTVTVRTADAPSGAVRIEVEDNAGGIPAEVLPHIFRPFFTTKADSVGLGLGLAISHSIVAKLGGTLTVASTAGRGSTFCVELPTADRPAVPPPEPCRRSPSPTPSPTQPSVLVIDDDDAVGRSVARVLASWYRVRRVTTGAEGIELLRCATFDAIVCDLVMPHPNGRDIYEFLRAERQELVDRLIFITGGGFPGLLREFVEQLGDAVPVLGKPLSPEDLSAAVARIVDPAPRPH